MQVVQPYPDRPAAEPSGYGARATVGRTAEITGRVTRNGSSGFPVEPGRYHLYASLACPWSQRALIVRRVLGLERVIGLSLTDPVLSEQGWRFPEQSGGRDPLTGAHYLSELYLASNPGYTGRATVPLLWDSRMQRIVTNDFSQLTVQLETEFTDYHRAGAPDLYPADQRRDIDALSTLIYHAVNNGVYQCGFASSPTSKHSTRSSPPSTRSKSGWPGAASCWAASSPRPTCGCSRPSPDSTLSITPSTNATCTRYPAIRTCGATRVTCTSVPVSGTQQTSSRSSCTTTRQAGSTPQGSCLRGPM
jgi:hypothetical protein